MGILAGQKVFDQRSATKERNDVVSQLNDSKSGMHGVLISEKVGACGLNLVGASHIIFFGSLYSQDFENQAIGTNPPCGAAPTLY
jgi:SNF2 family DNA or RNA helicase